MKYLPLIATLFCLTNVSSVAAKEPSPKLTNFHEAIRHQVYCFENAYFSKAKNSSSKKEMAKYAIDFCLTKSKLAEKSYAELLDIPLEKMKKFFGNEAEELIIKRLDDLYDFKTSDRFKLMALITVMQENCKAENRAEIEEAKQYLHNIFSEEFAYYRSPETRMEAINNYTQKMKEDFLAKGEVAWCQEMKEFSRGDPEE